MQQIAFYEAIYRQSPIGIAGLALDGTWLHANPACCRILGFSEQELLGMGMHQLLYRNNGDASAHFPDSVSGDEQAPMIGCWRHKQGHPIWVQLDSTLVHADGQPRYLMLQIQDVTERQSALTALQQSEQRLDMVLESAGLGSWDCDLKTGELVVNRQWSAMLGYESDDIPLRLAAWRALLHPSDLARVSKAFDIHMRGGSDHFEAEYRMRTRSGGWCWVLGRGRVVVRDADGRAVRAAGTHLDVNARKHEQEHARHLSLHDVLTDLPNQRLLQDRLFVALNAARRSREVVAVVFIDLDNFKSINDQRGHSVGDLVLQVAAKRLRIATRGHDTVARVGGDEFVLVLNRCESRVSVEQAVDRLLEDLSLPIVVDGETLTLEASAGIALFPHHATDAQSLLRCADMAMYSAKRKGKGCCATYDAFAMLQHAAG